MVSSGDSVGCFPEPVFYIDDGFHLQFCILQAALFSTLLAPSLLFFEPEPLRGKISHTNAFNFALLALPSMGLEMNATIVKMRAAKETFDDLLLEPNWFHTGAVMRQAHWFRNNRYSHCNIDA